MDSDIVLSIVVITYNHEKYIREALDSILSQKVNFRYEVLVGDDHSHDSTPEIVSEYEEKYPDIFKAFLNSENLGVTRNSYELLMKTKGRYVTTLEGDDYWIDPDKLQIQIDFLENNPDMEGVSNVCYPVDEEGNIISRNTSYDSKRHWTYDSHIYTIDDCMNWKMPGQMSSCIYRNFFRENDHDYTILYKASPLVGDRTISLLIALHGDVFFMNRVMTHYRYIIDKNKNNWASVNERKNLNLQLFELMIRLEKYAEEEFGSDYEIRYVKEYVYYQAEECFRKSGADEDRKIADQILKESREAFSIRKKACRIKNENDAFKETVRAALKGYDIAQDCESLKNGTWKQFREKARDGKVIIFGAGDACDDYFRIYRRKDNPLCIIDNSSKKWGITYKLPDGSELEIKSPSEIFSSEENREKCVVLISSTVYYAEIAEQLEKAGVKNYFSFIAMESKRLYSRYFMWQNRNAIRFRRRAKLSTAVCNVKE